MNQLVIASQLDEDYNQSLREHLPHARVLTIPTGTPSDLPPEVSVLLARPINVRGYQAADTPPEGWPYGLKIGSASCRERVYVLV